MLQPGQNLQQYTQPWTRPQFRQMGGGAGNLWTGNQVDEIGLPQVQGYQSPFNMGDLGNTLTSLLPGGAPSAGLGGVGQVAGSLLKGLGSKIGSSAIGMAVKANPIGAALGAVQMIGGTLNRTKQAQQQHAAIGRQIESTEEAQVAADEMKDAQIEVAEENRDIGMLQGGFKSEANLQAIASKGEKAVAATGGLRSGEVETDIKFAEEAELEAGLLSSDSMARIYEQGKAKFEGQYESFIDQTNKQIAEMKASRRNLKTKWYQNIVG
tara:strand:+ start:1297 stop:2097 length:801 start_codon:yes stop_codon:yes gene_type:complete